MTKLHDVKRPYQSLFRNLPPPIDWNNITTYNPTYNPPPTTAQPLTGYYATAPTTTNTITLDNHYRLITYWDPIRHQHMQRIVPR